MKIFKKLTFDSAHFLPNVPEGHKCKNLHGHTYTLTLVLEAKINRPAGWAVDFTDVKALVKPIIDRIDHKLLNDIEGLENPTCEVISIWIFNEIKKVLPIIKSVELWETPNSGSIYEGEQEEYLCE